MQTLSVHLTDLCNSRCVFCVVDSPHYEKDSIEIRNIESFLLDHANRGYEVVNLHGGEATIHPHFFSVLRTIQDLEYPQVHLQTNGIKLSDRAFTNSLRELGVTLAIVSLHGGDASTHDSQTGTNGGFVKTVNGIKNAKTSGMGVRTNTVVTKQNVEQLAALTKLACSLDVDHINFSSLHPVGAATFSFDAITPSFHEVQGHLYLAIQIALALGKKVTLEGFPYCTIPNYQHLHLNEQSRKIKMLMRGLVIDDYDSFMNSSCRVFGPNCGNCTVKEKCGGVYPEYVDRKGWGEFHAIIT